MSEKQKQDQTLLTLKDRINYPYILSSQLLTIQEAILGHNEKDIQEAIDGLVAIIPSNYKNLKDDPFNKDLQAAKITKTEKEFWCGFPIEGSEHEVQTEDYFKKLQTCTDLLSRRGMLSRTVLTEEISGEWVGTTKKKVNSIRGWKVKVNKEQGIVPFFSWRLAQRRTDKLATNIVITGEAGIGKSYTGLDLARLLDKDFSIDQVVFTYPDFMELVLTLPLGRPIVFDEPSYAMGKRQWYKQLNQALVRTIESFRFKVHPLFIPIINMNLLDKTVRQYLVQYMAYMTNRGRGMVYELKPNQWKDDSYHYHIGNLKYGMLKKKCNKKTCLGCRQLKTCGELYAQYERKKARVQENRYSRELDESLRTDSQKMTDEEIETKLYPLQNEYTENGKIDHDLLRIVAKEKLKLTIGYNRTYRIKKLLKYHHPDEFD